MNRDEWLKTYGDGSLDDPVVQVIKMKDSAMQLRATADLPSFAKEAKRREEAANFRAANPDVDNAPRESQ